MGGRGSSSGISAKGGNSKAESFTVPDMTHMKRSQMNREVRDVWDRYMNDKASEAEVYAYEKAYNDKIGNWTMDKSEAIKDIKQRRETERKTNKYYKG